jgi:hypothetical protein
VKLKLSIFTSALAGAGCWALAVTLLNPADSRTSPIIAAARNHEMRTLLLIIIFLLQFFQI